MSGGVVVLAGGTGGAKFVRGVAQCMPPEKLTIIANTGDDVTMHGLRISPDVDILTYTLAGIVDPAKGWGIAGDTFHCLEQLRRYGREGWFNLGDRDLATHMVRTLLLKEGKAPSEVADFIRRRLGVPQQILPMSDQPVETHVQLDDGTLLHFQEYLVRRGAPENVTGVTYRNVGATRPAPGVLEAIRDADLILFAPSSPVASIGTILSVPGVFDAIHSAEATVAAVSPLMGDAPISGPSSQLMRALGIAVSNLGLCDAYGELIDMLVIHEADAADVPKIEERRIRALATDTLMPDAAASFRVACVALEALGYAITRTELPTPEPFVAPTPEVGAHYQPRAAEGEADLRELVRRLEAEVHELRTRAEEAAEESQVAWTEHDALAETIEELERRLGEAHEDASAAADDVEVAWAEHDALQEHLQDLERRLQGMQARAHNVESDLEGELQDLEREAAAATEARLQADREIAALRRRLAEMETRAAASQHETRHERSELEELRDRWRAEREQAKQSVGKLRTRIGELEKEAARERERGDALNARVAATQAERERLTERVQDLERQVQAASAQLVAARTALDVSEQRIAQLEQGAVGPKLELPELPAVEPPRAPAEEEKRSEEGEGEPALEFEFPAESLSWKPKQPLPKTETMAERARRRGRPENVG